MFSTLFSCRTPGYKSSTTVRPFSKDFIGASKDIVWKATLEAMADFKIAESNYDQGVIITTWYEDSRADYFVQYGSSKIFRRNKYHFTVFIRGIGSGHNVKVIKDEKVETDDLGTWKVVKSNGYVEKSILYRIGHLIALEKYIEKKTEAANEQDY